MEQWRGNSEPLYARIKEELIGMIRNGKYENNRLPPESSLSETFGVSRATIREALASLNREGIVSKRHGIGNLIHRSTLDSKMRIDRYVDFAALLEDAGYRVEVRRLAYRRLEANGDLYIELCYYANEKPSIRAEVTIPGCRLKSDPLGDTSLYDTLPAFLNTWANEPVSHSLCYFRPAAATPDTAGVLGMAAGDPVLEWEESFYGIFDNVLAGTMICFNPEVVSFSLLRKWE